MYEKLSLEEFGRQLVLSGDLDPVYTALSRVEYDGQRMRRLLFAYWCCYNLGEADYLSTSEGNAYWFTMQTMAENSQPSPVGRWPRGRERRHFRGEKAIEAIGWFWKNYSNRAHGPVTTLETLFSQEEEGPPLRTVPYVELKKVVCEWPQFGPWIAFKVGDMLERVLHLPVDFTDSDVFFFDSPREAAKSWAMQNFWTVAMSDAPKVAVEFLKKELGHLSAPPSFDRSLNIQEFETILCKWKAHQNGIYPIGSDIKELKHSLEPWVKAGYAEALYAALV